MAFAFLAHVDDRAPSLPGDVRLMNATANALFVLFAIGAVVLAAHWLVRQSGFALARIRIEGDVARNSVSTIRANAAPRLAGNFFTADLGSMRQAFESVPWVRQAVVSRVWPNRLVVRLEEHRPAAVWTGDPTTEKLVNTHGEVFEANVGDVEDDGLPTLGGPDGSSAHVLAMWGRLMPVFGRIEAHVDGLTLSQRGSWRAELDSGAEVELGRGSDDEVIARSERFIATVPQVTQRYQRPLEYADLRHRDGYAVRLKGITTVAPKNQQTKN
jgi:cell division protein FtsQ